MHPEFFLLSTEHTIIVTFCCMLSAFCWLVNASKDFTGSPNRLKVSAKYWACSISNSRCRKVCISLTAFMVYGRRKQLQNKFFILHSLVLRSLTILDCICTATMNHSLSPRSLHNISIFLTTFQLAIIFAGWANDEEWWALKTRLVLVLSDRIIYGWLVSCLVISSEFKFRFWPHSFADQAEQVTACWKLLKSRKKIIWLWIEWHRALGGSGQMLIL